MWNKTLIMLLIVVLVPACSTDGHWLSEKSEKDHAKQAQAEVRAHRPATPHAKATSVPHTASFLTQAPETLRPTASMHALIPSRPAQRETYAHFTDNPVKQVAEHPVSTFSIDVDTGAYSNVRRILNQGRLPRSDAVRTEELVNYFDYDYALPDDAGQPFGISTQMTSTPWNKHTHLLQIGIQGRKPQAEIRPSNLVFLIDVSGSMHSPDKLPLLQSALKLLTKQLGEKDRIGIVVYASAAGTVLPPTRGDKHATIMAAIDRLRAGGSTNGGAGIHQAYALAQQAFIKQGVNRVILASDGDFNVGTTNFNALIDLVVEKRQSGIALTTLGFGSGNYNERLIEQLSNKGDGNYAYIDNLSEARRVLVEKRAATLQTIAKDVKVQIEFNPAKVAEYRLIGYENRALARTDFNNDRVDAGDIGAGHTVTALYEIALVGSNGERMDTLRYAPPQSAKINNANELAFLRLRYKMPGTKTSRLIEKPITRDAFVPLEQASNNLRFAAAVAGFGQLLRGGKYTKRYNYTQVLELARQARGADVDGRRGEFLQLVQLADALSTHTAQARRAYQPGTAANQ